MVETSQAPTRAANNYDALRLLAAAAVVVSHAFTVSYGSDRSEPLDRFSHGQATLGHVAVLVFFAISGVLISQSWERGGGRPVRFVRARALRLFPALVVNALGCSLVLGPLMTRLPLRAYFTAPLTYVTALQEMTLQWTHGLPGVFDALPLARTINGSLWTLAPEVGCYAAVLLAGLAGRLGPRTALAVAAAVTVMLLGGHPYHALRYAELCGPFAVGAAFHFLRPRLDGRVAALCAVACGLALRFGHFDVVAMWAGSYAVYWMALTPRLRLASPTRFGDLSYGLYIWSCPLQQVAASLLLGRENWALNVAIALPASLVLAAASWRFVEAPALRLKWARPGPRQAGGRGTGEMSSPMTAASRAV